MRNTFSNAFHLTTPQMNPSDIRLANHIGYKAIIIL